MTNYHYLAVTVRLPHPDRASDRNLTANEDGGIASEARYMNLQRSLSMTDPSAVARKRKDSQEATAMVPQQWLKKFIFQIGNEMQSTVDYRKDIHAYVPSCRLGNKLSGSIQTQQLHRSLPCVFLARSRTAGRNLKTRVGGSSTSASTLACLGKDASRNTRSALDHPLCPAARITHSSLLRSNH